MRLNRRTVLAAVVALFLATGLSAARADTYAVTNKNASGPGSLAQAIHDSNAHAGQDMIVFNIPGAGVHLIDLSQSFLPEITDSVILDGYTQPGAHPNTLSIGNNAVILIQLDGGLVKRNGIGLRISGSNCLVRGLALTGFQFDPSSDPFLFTVRGGFGIQLLGAGTGNVIQGNFIGLYPDGVTPRANYVGIRVEGAYGIIGHNVIGGTEPSARNLISGNQSGAENFGSSTVFLGNYIGTDATGMKAAGNLTGLKIAGNDVVIGGSDAGSGNVISGNQFDAIALGFTAGYHYTAGGNRAVIQGNLIGTGADGSSALGNGGAAVNLWRNPNSTIGGLHQGAGNVIAFNGQGVTIVGGGSFGIGNRILSNSIYANRTRGIILYHATSNNGQSAPVITFANSFRGVTIIRGTLHSTPNTEFLLQFFNDSQSLTTSKQTYIGSTSMTTDGAGNGAFSATFAVNTGSVFNATATDPNGNTSEFSLNPAYLQNISTRAAVGTGDQALIAGFIADVSRIFIRGIGPSLKPYGFSNVVADPTLALHNQAGAQIAFNDNWKDDPSQAALIQEAGLAPTDDAESAIEFHDSTVNTSTTAVLQGKDQTTGVGVVEAYSDIRSFFIPGFANLSSRGFVGTGDNVMIGGFILGGGSQSPRIVVRAIGPSLNAAGVANALVDPVLELYDGNGLLIQSNDNWADAQEADLQTVGLAPTDGAESAILARLGPGAYTAIVRGKDNATGVALVEVYNLR